jgi:hypothetical protein
MLDQDSIILASSTSCAIVPNNVKRRSQMTFIDGAKSCGSVEVKSEQRLSALRADWL